VLLQILAKWEGFVSPSLRSCVLGLRLQVLWNSIVSDFRSVQNSHRLKLLTDAPFEICWEIGGSAWLAFPMVDEK